MIDRKYRLNFGEKKLIDKIVTYIKEAETTAKELLNSPIIDKMLFDRTTKKLVKIQEIKTFFEDIQQNG